MPSSNTENREQTFDEKLDEILLQHGAEEGELTHSLKQAIKTLMLEVLDKLEAQAVENVNFVKVTGIRHIEDQRQIINPQKEVK